MWFRERDANKNKSGKNNGEIIAAEPSSELKNAYNIYLSEQERDEDIMWIKELILINKDKRPKLNKIENSIRRCLYREYDNLRVLDGLVYRSTEDINGYNRMQYVLPFERESTRKNSTASWSGNHSSEFDAKELEKAKKA